MGYYADLTKISIDQYKEELKSKDLIPSRLPLRDNIDNNFKLIKKQNIRNMDELYNILKNKKKLADFSDKSGIATDYLQLLIRKINGLRQKPNRIKDFPSITEELVLKLEKIKVKNTLQLFDRIITPESRRELKEQTGIDDTDLLKMTKLTDLSRIQWVNHTFAYVLHEAGFDTTEKVAQADFNKLYKTIKNLNKEREIYKGNIGLHDMKICVEAAQYLPLDVVY